MPALLVTGRPGSGKTTLARRALEDARPAAAGFYAQEIRAADGHRTGFEVVTLEGKAATLASAWTEGRYRVGRYCVDIDALDPPGVSAIVGARACNVHTDAGWGKARTGARGQPTRDRPLAE